MAGDRDDEALTWEGDDDAVLAPGWRQVGSPVASPMQRSELNEAATDRSAESALVDEAERAQLSSPALVVLGVFAGIYLLYTVGWVVVATRSSVALPSPVAQFMYALGVWLAAAAAPAWFGVVLWLTRGRLRVRMLWLAAGVIILVPIPFVVG